MVHDIYQVVTYPVYVPGNLSYGAWKSAGPDLHGGKIKRRDASYNVLIVTINI